MTGIALLPKVILLFSGKRKSGKDYVTDVLRERLGDDVCSVLRLSGPLKHQYAKEHGLDYSKLLDASHYKEVYRTDMIQWGEEKRNADPGYFCRIVVSGPGSEKPVWIISDCRRKTDVAYFQENFPGKTLNIRVVADELTREGRGWVYTSGVDDVESECGLDEGVSFDVQISNSGDSSQFHESLEQIYQHVQKKLTP